MSLQSKRWQIAPTLSEQDLAHFANVPPLVVQLLHNRKIRELDAIRDFLAGYISVDNPFQLKGMSETVTRLRQAIDHGERIAVYGDFDVDGVTATALLVQTLSALGVQVEPYIPSRVDEGYGLNLGALRRLWCSGVRVVVTVDCGIRSIREVREASKGMAMIVTDHHTPLDDLPPALAIINPKQPGCPYPHKNLAGVGLAFKLAQGLLRAQKQAGRGSELAEESLLDLVALGTVADLAPLLGENRFLVRRGLELLNEPRRPGIQALMADAGLRRGDVDASAIGFRLGPRLNAAGRIDSAMLAYRLLTSQDRLEAKELAGKLGQLNDRRQVLTEQTVTAAEEQVQAGDPDVYLLLVASKDFNPGIVGLAASRLTEAYYRPSIVVELGDDGESRGSCRSIPEFHITRALDRCKDLMIRHGGHKAAAGFTVATDKLDALRQCLQAIAAEQLAGAELRPTLNIDAEVHLDEVDWATHSLLSQIEPCGQDNPQPVFLSRDLEVRGRRAIGKQGKHLKLTLRDGRGAAWDAVYFRAGHLLSQIPARIDVAYALEINEWNHRKRLQVNVQDLRATSTGEGSL